MRVVLCRSVSSFFEPMGRVWAEISAQQGAESCEQCPSFFPPRPPEQKPRLTRRRGFTSLFCFGAITRTEAISCALNADLTGSVPAGYFLPFRGSAGRQIESSKIGLPKLTLAGRSGRRLSQPTRVRRSMDGIFACSIGEKMEKGQRRISCRLLVSFEENFIASDLSTRSGIACTSFREKQT